MFEKLVAAVTSNPMDVQIWECKPLAIVDGNGEVALWRTANVEFTPYDSASKKIGHAVLVAPDSDGPKPELEIDSRQHVAAPLFLSRRPGIILAGVDQNGQPATWLINGEADRLMLSENLDMPEYDEETAKQLEEELGDTPPDKLNLDSVF